MFKGTLMSTLFYEFLVNNVQKLPTGRGDIALLPVLFVCNIREDYLPPGTF